MELADMDLQTYLLNNQITTTIFYTFIDQISSALKYIHSKSLIHMDLKPKNIFVFLSNNQEEPIFKIGDFGESISLYNPFDQSIQTERLEITKQINCSSIGFSKLYVAPEIKYIDNLNRQNYFTQKSDIYSFALTILTVLGIPNSKLHQLQEVSRYNYQLFVQNMIAELKSKFQDLKDFISILEEMLSFDSANRISLHEILAFIYQKSNPLFDRNINTKSNYDFIQESKNLFFTNQFNECIGFCQCLLYSMNIDLKTEIFLNLFIAQSHYHQNDFTEALKICNKCIKLARNQYQSLRARVYILLGEINGQISDKQNEFNNYEIAQQLDNQLLPAIYFLFEKSEKSENCIQAQDVTECLPHWYEDFKTLVLFYVKQQNFVKAKQYLQQCIQICPQFYYNLVLSAHINFSEQKNEEAVQILFQAKRLNENNSNIHYQIATIYEAKQEYKSAKIYINQALQLNPKKQDYFEKQIQLLQMIGE